MNETCFAVIEKLYKSRPDDDRVFRSRRYKKRPIGDIKRAFENALIEAKSKISPGTAFVTRS
jgi:hypothetical protein